jgi:hypothetical protein
MTPPHSRVGGSLGANHIVVNLADELHGPPATLRYLFGLYPKGHSEISAFLLRRLANDFDCFGVVLTLTVQKIEVLEPMNFFRHRMEFNEHSLIAAREHFETVASDSDYWTAETVW